MTTQPMTLDRLKKARGIAARAVELHGEEYLDYFQRLHEEIEMLEKRQADLALAMQFARVS